TSLDAAVRDKTPRGESEVRKLAIMSLAGMIAEKVSKDKDRQKPITKSDMQRTGATDSKIILIAVSYLGSESDEEARLWLMLLQCQAYRELERHWEAVEAVAQDLLQ